MKDGINSGLLVAIGNSDYFIIISIYRIVKFMFKLC